LVPDGTPTALAQGYTAVVLVMERTELAGSLEYFWVHLHLAKTAQRKIEQLLSQAALVAAETMVTVQHRAALAAEQQAAVRML
jgi:hypothetical protein